MPSPAEPEVDTPHGSPVSKSGPLFVIGGAEDKLRKRAVLTEFVNAAGGAQARIAVIPTASSLGPEVVEVYDAVFRKLGAAEVYAVRPESREQAHDPAFAAPLESATGVFMTGGNQLKLSAVVAGTAFGEAIRAAHHRGAVVGGTSAGASIQSSHMVAFGNPGATPKQRMTQVAAGLGLIDQCVIDQHFDQRNRYGRLLMIVSQSPQLLGIGVDEDTAAVVQGDELRVIGKGAVTIFDPARMISSAHEAKRNSPIMASGVQLHVLPAGCRFHLGDRVLIIDDVEDSSDNGGEANPSGIEEVGPANDLAAAGRELAKLARDIAAGDVSPSVLRRRRARRTQGGT